MGDSCAICGRTILAGERVHGYFDGDEERTVCELCLARAERLAWRPANEPEPERQGRRHEGRDRLRGLLRRRHRRPGGHAATISKPDEPDPAIASRRARPLPALDDRASTPFERAAARFNSSEAGRAVAGLTRTLGVPRASVGASAGAPGEVRVTVAWELSWYQWGVDVGDELRPVFELGKGGEIDQLDAAARQWNAVVAADGVLRLAGDRAASR
ncbi:MAG TPA: hypothetical protein VFN92_05635 [Solirubrobacterales bacterium]|nr:hypothetical protein [Solirubrobacterales bacterium]